MCCRRSGLARLIRTIQIGMSEEEVVAHLGKPQKQEARGDMKFLFYATPWQVAEKAKQRSPIAIKDGKIVGLGVSYLAKFEPASRFPWDAWVVQVSAEEARLRIYSTLLHSRAIDSCAAQYPISSPPCVPEPADSPLLRPFPSRQCTRRRRQP